MQTETKLDNTGEGERVTEKNCFCKEEGVEFIFFKNMIVYGIIIQCFTVVYYTDLLGTIPTLNIGCNWN